MGIAAVRVALFLASALAFAHAVPVATAGSQQQHGRELVGEYELPAELISQFGERARDGSASRAPRTSWTDPTLWSGPMRSVGVGRNPYTIVLTARGTAPATGNVRTHWHAGWEVRESAAASREMLVPLTALSSGSVQAGAAVMLTAVTGPVSFRGEREAAPLLDLLQAQNFDLQSVHLAVWSGSAPMVWPRWPSLLFGLLFAAAWAALRHPPTGWQGPKRAAPVPAASQPAVMPTSSPGGSSAPEPPATTQAARVIAALHDVLATGLVVPTLLDDKHRPSRRGPGG